MEEYSAQRVVTVRNPQGLHARPADMFVRLAQQFVSSIEVLKNGERFEGKSILSLLTLAAAQGTELILRAHGPDADQALTALADLFGRGFNEMPCAEPVHDPSIDR